MVPSNSGAGPEGVLEMVPSNEEAESGTSGSSEGGGKEAALEVRAGGLNG